MLRASASASSADFCALWSLRVHRVAAVDDRTLASADSQRLSSIFAAQPPDARTDCKSCSAEAHFCQGDVWTPISDRWLQ
jgi:hypothetical protein